MPLAISAETVMRLRSRGESLSSRDQTSPNNTSSLSCANLGANLPIASLPAVTLSMTTILSRKRERGRLCGSLPSVYCVNGAADIACLVGSQKGGNIGNFLRRAEAAEGDARGDVLPMGFGCLGR